MIRKIQSIGCPPDGFLASTGEKMSQEKLARTIADLANETHIIPTHLAEAVQYRFKTE